MLIFVCYEKCTTCQKAKKWLEDNNIEYVMRPIKEQNPSEEELKQWIARSGLPVRRFFNTSGMLYRSMNLKDRLETMSDEEQIALLATDGMLVKRPLLVTETVVIPGFREEAWRKALG